MMNTATINGIQMKYPAAWDNMTREQLFYFVDLFLQEIPVVEIKISLLFEMLGIRFKSKQTIVRDGEDCFWIKLKNDGEMLISSRDIKMLTSGLDFLFTNENGQARVHSTLTKNLVSELRIKHKWFYGPSEKLFNLTWNEFIQADSCFSDFNNSKEEKDLDRLIAVLYRPQEKNYDPDATDFTGDRREAFNDHLIDKRAKTMARLDQKRKYSVYLFYCGCKNYLKKTFDLVFEGGEDAGNNSHGYLTLNDCLSKDFGDSPENIRNYMLYDVLERSQNSRKTQIEFDKKLKNK